MILPLMVQMKIHTFIGYFNSGDIQAITVVIPGSFWFFLGERETQKLFFSRIPTREYFTILLACCNNL